MAQLGDTIIKGDLTVLGDLKIENSDIPHIVASCHAELNSAKTGYDIKSSYNISSIEMKQVDTYLYYRVKFTNPLKDTYYMVFASGDIPGYIEKEYISIGAQDLDGINLDTQAKYSGGGRLSRINVVVFR